MKLFSFLLYFLCFSESISSLLFCSVLFSSLAVLRSDPLDSTVFSREVCNGKRKRKKKSNFGWRAGLKQANVRICVVHRQWLLSCTKRSWTRVGDRSYVHSHPPPPTPLLTTEKKTRVKVLLTDSWFTYTPHAFFFFFLHPFFFSS